MPYCVNKKLYRNLLSPKVTRRVGTAGGSQKGEHGALHLPTKTGIGGDVGEMLCGGGGEGGICSVCIRSVKGTWYIVMAILTQCDLLPRILLNTLLFSM